MSDPLRWWPGKYAECKRMAQLVEEFLPSGDVLEAGGLGIFADLLPRHCVTTARLSERLDRDGLPYEDDRFDICVSARVLELLPARLQRAYLTELLRVSRFRVFVALPLQPELEAIDKIKSTYIWDTSRVWQHRGVRPDELEAMLQGEGVCLAYHVEPPSPVDLARLEASQEMLDSLLLASALRDTAGLPCPQTPAFVVAEISKTDVLAQALAGLCQEAH